ncbi:MAG: hypothetical protein Q8R98_10495 [Rubrivivax sp.]|nr:hypothetical protein [Rubrivivax sp.]MDP3612270.1 hypothetical protein [Rubrivivax sp.]
MNPQTPSPPPLRLLERPLRRAVPGSRTQPLAPAEQAWWLRWLGMGQARKG